MRMTHSNRLNKEKVAFLAATLIASAGLCVFLSSGPRPLVLGPPSTREPGPEADSNPIAIERKLINSLVDSGQRESPFYPVRHIITDPEEKKVVGGDPLHGGGGDNGKKKEKDFPPVDIASEVDYMGVTVVNGERRGLLKPKNGAAPFLVAKGESIPHYSYTVSKIEPQAIEIVDNADRPFTLKDRSYGEW